MDQEIASRRRLMAGNRDGDIVSTCRGAPHSCVLSEVYLLQGPACLLFDVGLSDSALINTHLLVPMLLFPVFSKAGHCPEHAGLAWQGIFTKRGVVRGLNW